MSANRQAAFDVGDRVTCPGHGHSQTARVMAVAERWAMCRYPRAMPFVAHFTDLRPAGDDRG